MKDSLREASLVQLRNTSSDHLGERSRTKQYIQLLPINMNLMMPICGMTCMTLMYQKESLKASRLRPWQ